MSYKYLNTTVGAEDESEVVAGNVAAILQNEMGMERVSHRSELVDGKFLVARTPGSVFLYVTLNDRPFTCRVMNEIFGRSEYEKYKGTIMIYVNQLAPSGHRHVRTVRQTFGDKVWRRNVKRGGIEVSFESKPSEAMRTAMKSGGFRFSKACIWYAKESPSAMKLVQDMNLTKVNDVNDVK